MIIDTLEQICKQALLELYQIENKVPIQIQKTRKDVEGDFTLVVFPFLRFSKKSPEQTAEEMGAYLVSKSDLIESYSIIKGFLNIHISTAYWMNFFVENHQNNDFGKNAISTDAETIVIEYSSPNTNKPLHLGHIRNNLLGWSVAEILLACGKNVKKVNLVNDRGIHICKSMLAWQKFGEGVTPESAGQKGDKLVGDYYVKFDQEYKLEIKALMEEGMEEDEAKKQAPLILETQVMLKKWESNDPETRALWEKMNGWVYDGFDVTYKRLGIDFDKVYYESNTYLDGKRLVEEGLKQKVLFQKENTSVWIDLQEDGLDEKLLLRADGTSVYMTQDLGTAVQRNQEFAPKKMIYVVGNEQEYHFQVLKLVLKKLGENWADSIYHLSYGMVELPHGKMKSREGTVVDADDLMDEMYRKAKEVNDELGKNQNFEDEEATQLLNTLSLGALKYFMLKVDPRKKMLFNPEESIDFNGNTAPFIQYTYARIQSLIRKANVDLDVDFSDYQSGMIDKEKELIKTINEYPQVVLEAGENLSPALIANYVYELVKEFNQYYQEVKILQGEDKRQIVFRLALSSFIANTIKSGLQLLGIQVPDRM